MSEINVLKKQRSVNKGKLTFLLNSLKRNPGDISIEECKAKLSRAEKLMDEFTTIENQIFALDQEQEPDMEYEENYYKAITELSVLMKKQEVNTIISDVSFNNPNAINFMQSANAEVRLPKLNIPPFAGDYKEWQSFYDLYLATVHESTSLSHVQKFQYLKGLLRGEAASLLRHLPITEANYIEALQKLQQRYDRKKHIITSFIRTFVEQPIINTATSTNITKLLDTSDEVLRGLRAAGADGDSKDPWLIYILTNKLDEESKIQWAQHTAEMEFPTIDDLFAFLLRRGDTLASLKSCSKRSLYNKEPSIKGHIVSNSFSCGFCSNSEHMTCQCPQLNAMVLDERRQWAKNGNRCFNCLRSDHGVFKCKSKRRCTICNMKHHSLLHTDQATSISTSHVNNNDEESIVNSANINCVYASNQVLQTVLPTAVINVVTDNGKVFRCRALLDSGSQASFITESCVQMMKLRRKNARISVSGLGNLASETTRGKATLTLQTRVNDPSQINIDVLILPQITSNLPAYTIDRSEIERFNLQEIGLADPYYFKPNKIDLLIGAEHFFQILEREQITNKANKVVLQKTVFGWVVAGQMSKIEEMHGIKAYSSTTMIENTDNIDKTLRRFWEIEEVKPMSVWSSEEEFCENHFKHHTSNAADGKYVVKLPFKENKPELGSSLQLAIRRFQSVERRLQRDSGLCEEYKNFMAEYEKLGHMREIDATEGASVGNYLPHHGVLKQSSTTTKLRVVFDASTKTSNHVSLNDCLAVGPTVQSSLTQILLRFREHKIVFAADIEKMYRQIWVNNEDTKYQRIVWRKRPSEPIRHYELLTVTYGTASAPFLATRALREVGIQYKQKCPIIANIILNDFYVDDLLSGAETVDEAIKLKEGVTAALMENGFHIRKWKSNSLKLNEQVPENIAVSIVDQPDTTKVLGLKWDPTDDRFHFDVNIEDSAVVTKRKVLSNVSRIFDPLGLLAPVIVTVKIFIQHLWVVKLGWDHPLNEDLLLHWTTIYESLKAVQYINIPRFIGSTQIFNVELHGFCDASERAYAAVVYFRITMNDGSVVVNLISSKTKVSPLKQLSIPRLELCGAVLLTNLINFIIQNSSLHISQISAWTDSKIVLDWLSSPPYRWKTFVGNRTSKIIEKVPRENWYYIRSTDNPADCASRGLCAKQLKNFDLWWNGPKWLRMDKDKWPTLKVNIDGSSEEVRRQVFELTVFDNDNLVEEVAEKFSSFHKCLRIFAYVHRFLQNCKTPKSNRIASTIFTRDELYETRNLIVKAIQSKYFNEEVTQLKKGKAVPKSSKLITLNPFSDKYGVLRVGGRLTNSNATYDAKHPIILPYNSIISTRIVDEAHLDYKHAGASLLLANLRQHFWILRAKRIIRKIISKCVTCTKIKAKTEVQIMADLPAARSEFIRPFLKVGLDFAGPISIHQMKGRGQKTYKSYICLFICLSVKAVHLELVGDLSSESFLAALKRFVSRRGLCTDIYSDNGTNFVGANKLLTEKFENLINNSNECSHFLSQKFITWHFNPPSAPSFGGIWERAIRSMKQHLKKSIGDQILTLEEMTTLLVEVEAVLNSRPLCILSSDDLDILTPSHFLIGHSITKIPEINVSEIQTSFNKRWQNVQRIAQQFHKRWHVEYLTSLQQRVKWHTTKSNVKVGDVVVIKEDDVSSTHWMLGKVVAVHPGNDNIVRVVTLKTKSGLLKRPINKICILPVESDDSRLALYLDMSARPPTE